MYLQGLWEFMAFYLVGVWNLDDVIVTHLDPEDYTKLTKALTFTDTITTIPVSIDIEDDLVFEPTERFNISLSTSSDGCAISPGNEITPVYIMDNGEIMHNACCTYQVKVQVFIFDGHWARSRVVKVWYGVYVQI